jgi:DNA polymerase-4
VFLPVDREEYEAVSATVMGTLRGFGAVTEVMGWDEAFVAETDDPEGGSPGDRGRIRARPSSTPRSGSGRTSCRPSWRPGSASRPGCSG